MSVDTTRLLYRTPLPDIGDGGTVSSRGLFGGEIVEKIGLHRYRQPEDVLN